MRNLWFGVIIALAFGVGHERVTTASNTATTTDAPSEGRLVTERDGKTVDLPLEHTDVRIRIDGHIAEATVTQRFHNKSSDKIEALYLFPLPGDAAVGDMSIVTSGREIQGTIHRRAEARRIYKRAKKKGHIAALLTQERENLFTQSVANIEPGATVKVVIRYVQPLVYDDGGYELTFPMVAPARYSPGTAASEAPSPTTLAPAVRSAHDISLAVELDAGVAVKHIESPSHRLETTGHGATRRVALAAGDTIPNRDFVLRYRVAGDQPEIAVLAHRESASHRGSFFLVAQPPTAVAPADVRPREIIFVLDTSSSMRNRPLVMATAVINKVLDGLRPHDTYQIVRFSDAASVLGAAPIANKPKNLAITREWLAGLRAGGGTEMVAGIGAALAVPSDPARLRIAVFLTDGFIGNEDEILALVGERMGATRLFSFGVGSTINRYLLEEMALVGRGAAQLVRPSDNVADAASAFFRRIDRPVLTDVAIDWGDLEVSDLNPQRVPDLFVGQPLVVAGRYTKAGNGTVVVSGNQAGKPVRFEVPVTLPEHAERRAVASVWARRAIADLTRAQIQRSDPARIERIVGIALEHKLMSRFTAFVAVDRSAVTAAGDARTVTVPVEVPRAARSISYGASQGAIGSGGGGGMGYGMVSRSNFAVMGRVAKPSIQLSRARVYGSLSGDIIRNQVRRRTAQIRHCYERALMKEPTLAGTLVVKLAIESTGKIKRLSMSGMKNSKLIDCVTRRLNTLEFPKWSGDDLVVVNYPFVFKPSGKIKTVPAPIDVRKKQ